MLHLCSRMARLAAIALLLAVAPSLRAEFLVGVGSSNALFAFRSEAPQFQFSLGTVSGIVAGQTLVGIDYRPNTNEVYALSYAQSTGAAQLYKLDLFSAALTTVGTGFVLDGAGAPSDISIDFNPSTDRFRIVSESDASYRVNPITGALIAKETNPLAFGANDPNNGDNPGIAGIGYSNNIPVTSPATPTTLFGYDRTNNALVTIGGPNGSPSPNDGQLFTLGSSNLTATGPVGFDISGSTGVAFVSANGSLYTVALSGPNVGNHTFAGSFGFGVLDITVVPAGILPAAATVPVPASLLLALVGSGTLGWVARRRANRKIDV